MLDETGHKTRSLSPDALDFAPGLLAIQESPPARLPRVTLYLVTVLFLILLGWSVFGKLDIVASAEGRLVPQSYVKIVQPADAGIVQEILIQEGQHVQAGQVLMRMDTKDAKADESTLQMQLALRSLQLRRIDAELSNKPMTRLASDPDDLFRQVASQYADHRHAYTDALEQVREAQARAGHDAASGREVLAKLREVTPILKQQADSYAEMGKDGYVPQLQVRDKQREFLEKSRDLKAQESTLASLEAAMNGVSKQAAELTSKYHSDLQNERIEAEGQYRKLQQDMVKHEHRSSLLELKAPQSGIAKDLATHTTGTVVSPGTVLLSLVPDNEPLVAEVMVRNDDVGFVYPHQKVKIKLAAYPFQQYGMLDGEVLTIGADASDMQAQGGQNGQNRDKDKTGNATIYKALVSLPVQQLNAENKQYKLLPGMQVVAEINQGKRTVLEYILSPLQKTVRESGRER
ncbi:HlyD family type I secretion periplasmic adaptor subunit [Undibacterium sp. TJN19]|uniref:HlyD family type I secretion periplasmic adaptor subunit n=1 Tax=Undibacterium sp. TJN19 TaxID=3413055 RepID=UPI003BEFD4C3